MIVFKYFLCWLRIQFLKSMQTIFILKTFERFLGLSRLERATEARNTANATLYVQNYSGGAVLWHRRQQGICDSWEQCHFEVCRSFFRRRFCHSSVLAHRSGRRIHTQRWLWYYLEHWISELKSISLLLCEQKICRYIFAIFVILTFKIDWYKRSKDL